MFDGFVIGIDLSLTSTGLAAMNAQGDAFTDLVTSTGTNADTVAQTADRISRLADQIVGKIDTIDPPLVLIESAFFSTRADTSAHRRAGLWWAVVTALRHHGHAPVAVSPSQVKKWATGTGNASKEKVLIRATSVWGEGVLAEGRDDRADALVLAAIGSHRLGGTLPCTLTDYRQSVVDSVFATAPA